MTPRFAIYYADGSVAEGGGEDDELVRITMEVSRDWLTAPSDGIVGVVSEKSDGSRAGVLRGVEAHGGALFGTEFYFPIEDGEYGFADDLGAWLRKLGSVVKRGEYVSSVVMHDFWQWAKSYARIPRL